MFDKNKIIELAKTAINTEILGLKSLVDNSFDDNFTKLVIDILKIKERVFFSAVGKPGYVARKAAASLASTGTPSFFIHPTEASHGDLGMITKNDMMILLSNSGGSSELNDIISYCKRFSIELVGITRNSDSFLAKSVDLPIVLQNIQQTNSVNSPTTDTIMFMAYLDALTTVLIEQRQFNIDNFKTFHPGGKLGAYMLKVKDIMRTGVSIPLIGSNKSMEEALGEMNLKNLGCVGILDNNGHLIGLISDGDLRRKTIEYGNVLSKSIEEIMTKNPKCIEDDKLAVEAVAAMTEKERYIQILFVVNTEREVVGILHIQDLFKAKII